MHILLHVCLCLALLLPCAHVLFSAVTSCCPRLASAAARTLLSFIWSGDLIESALAPCPKTSPLLPQRPPSPPLPKWPNRRPAPTRQAHPTLIFWPQSQQIQQIKAPVLRTQGELPKAPALLCSALPEGWYDDLTIINGPRTVSLRLPLCLPCLTELTTAAPAAHNSTYDPLVHSALLRKVSTTKHTYDPAAPCPRLPRTCPAYLVNSTFQDSHAAYAPHGI